VFWGSSEGFKESHINWQGIFLKILIFFGEKRKYLGMLLLRWKKSGIKIDLGSHDLSIWRQKITGKTEMHARASYQFSVLSVNGLQSKLGTCRASAPACRVGRQECLAYNALRVPIVD